MNGRPKILIVDDEPLNVDYLEQELDDLGYSTISAANGQEALERVEAEAPDLVLLDIMMPVMDGFEVLSRLKANRAWRDIPVIVVSAMSDIRSTVKGIELGADDYLPKPFEPVLLHARLTNSLEKKRLRDQEQLYLRSLEQELEIGRNIQAGFLPETLPQPPGWELAAYFQAAREVAGDFYDVFSLPNEGRIGLVLGDVCDKGVGSALYMTLFRSLIRVLSGAETGQAASGQPVPDVAASLARIVSLTNNYIAYTHSRANMFATLFFGMLDPQSGSLAYINAGQEPPVIIGPDGPKAHLRPTGPVVGLIPNSTYGVEVVTIEPGDILLVYTDGVPDAQSPGGEFYGDDQLSPIFDHGYGGSVSALVDDIASAVRQHVGDAAPTDDVTLLALGRVAGGADPD